MVVNTWLKLWSKVPVVVYTWLKHLGRVPVVPWFRQECNPIFIIAGFHLHSKLPTVVPESCLLIVLGLIVGLILHYSRVASTSEYVLNAEVFFIYLLPPIIFDAGYFMPIRSFFDNVGTVLLLAVVNTAFNTACIGFSLFAVSYWGLIGRSLSLLHCLIFRQV